MGFQYDIIDIARDTELSGLFGVIEQGVGVPCSIRCQCSCVLITCKNTDDFTKIYMYIVKNFFDVFKEVHKFLIDFSLESSNYATFNIDELMKTHDADYVCDLLELTPKFELSNGSPLHWICPTSKLTQTEAKTLQQRLRARDLIRLTHFVYNSTMQTVSMGLYLKTQL